MSTITFLSTEIDTKVIKCNLKEKMKDVCNRYAKEVNINIKRLLFFSDGQRLKKKMSVNEFNKSNPEQELFVVIMDEDVDSESEEEKEKAKSEKLKEEIIDSIKNTNKEITYEKTQELIVQYGFDCQKRIKREKEEHPENFIEIEEAIKKKDKDEKLYALGQLGKSLENMGIEVAINKTEGKNKDDSLIVNQIISSGILQEKKYEIHLEENDINKKNAIINNENGEQEKFIDEFKGFLSQQISIPKKDIIITNIREGSITLDTAFKKKHNINIRESMIKLSQQKNIKSIHEKNILESIILSPDMFDKRGDRAPSEWLDETQIRGGLPYYTPTHDWTGYGLKVWDQYDNKNNDWIEMNGNPNEWAVAFHGTSLSAVKPICEKGGKFFSSSKEGAKGQVYQHSININIKSKKLYPKCGEGTYVSPHLEYASGYATNASKNTKTSPVVIMCRVNPNFIRIPEGQGNKENIWITDGTRNTIRPYRILINKNNN